MLSEDEFWRHFSDISSVHTAELWESTLRQLGVLMVLAKRSNLHQKCIAACYLKSADILADFGGLGHRLRSLSATRIVQSMTPPQNEPSLFLQALGIESRALYVLGDMAATRRVYESQRNLQLVVGAKHPVVLEALINEGQFLGRNGQFNRASTLLCTVKEHALDSGIGRLIVWSVARQAENLLHAGGYDKALENVAQARGYAERMKQSGDTKESIKFEMYLDRIESKYLAITSPKSQVLTTLLHKNFYRSEVYKFPYQFIHFQRIRDTALSR